MHFTVLFNRTCSPLPYTTLFRSAGVARARAAGLLAKNPALYSLRHTHASLMLDQRMSLWALSRHMGHASQAITEQVYAHLMPRSEEHTSELQSRGHLVCRLLLEK